MTCRSAVYVTFQRNEKVMDQMQWFSFFLASEPPYLTLSKIINNVVVCVSYNY